MLLVECVKSDLCKLIGWSCHILLTIRLKWHNSIVIGQFQSINNVRLLTNHYHHFDVIVNLEEVIIALNMKAIFAIKNTTIAVKKKKKKKKKGPYGI